MTTAQDNAPIGATADVSPQWPAEHEWPAADAHPRDHVRFYRDRLGLRCYPTPSLADVLQSAKRFYLEAENDWREDHKGADPTGDDRSMLLDLAREEAEATRKGPLALTHKAFTEAPVISDEMIERGWGGKNAGRGIAVALGRSTKGHTLAQVDVDPRHGGEVDGPLVAGLVSDRATSMVASTPGGGLHIYVLGDSTLRPQVSGALAPGVELRTTGYAMMPSGSSSAVTGDDGNGGRAWVSTGWPQRAPDVLRHAVHRVGGAAHASSRAHSGHADTSPARWSVLPTPSCPAT